VIVGRILQGGSNITFGLAYLIMRERLSGSAFGVCCGLLSAVNAGVAGLDALLGGFMVDHFGFRSIFMLTLVAGIGAVVLSWKAVPADQLNGAAAGRIACITPLAVSGVVQAPADEPGSLTGIANAGFGIGGSLGFGWAGTIVAQWTKAGFESALWICVAIGVAALTASIILKPRLK
jgi:hypothetical protein